MHGSEPVPPGIRGDAWQREQVRVLYAGYPFAAGAALLIAGMLAAVQWSAAGAANCLIWIAVLGAVTAARAVPVLAFRRAGPDVAADRWLTWYRAGALAAGLAWALGVGLLFPPGDLLHQLFLALAIGALCAGSASAPAVDRISTLGFAVPPLVLLIGLLLVQGTTIHLAASAMVACCLAFVVLNGGRAHRWLRELTNLRSEAVARAETLRISDARYQDLFENSSDLILSASADGRLNYVNRACRITLGYPDQDLAGHMLAEIVAEDSRTACAAALQRVLAGEEIGLLDLELVARDGRRVAVEGRVNARVEDGKAVSTRAIFRDVTERHKAEQRMEANERLLDSIIENLPAMVFLKRADDLSFERVNQVGLRLLGRESAEMIGRRDHDLWPKEQADFFVAVDRQALAQTDVLEITEEPIATAESGLRYLRTSKIALRDEERRPTHLLGLSVDITEQRLAEEALRRLNAELEDRVRERTAAAEAGEQFIRATMDALIARVAVLDESGIVVAINAAWREFGSEPGMAPYAIFEGDNYLDACDRFAAEGILAEASEIAAAIRDVIAGRRDDCAVEHASLVADKQQWYLCRVSRFAADGPGRVVVTHDDVTDVHDARAAAAAGARMIASLDAVAPVGIFRLDAQGNTRSVNRRYCEITGLDPDELLDDGWRKAVHPEDVDRVIGAWNSAVRTHSPVQVEYRFVHRDGSVVWVIGQTVEILDPSGAVTGYVGTLTDVTERRALESQLAQAVKMEAIGNLTGGIAHDFNNFLGIIMGNLDLLRERAAGDPGATKLIDAALRGATRSADLTQSLLAFSRRQPLDPRLTNISQRLGLALDLLKRSLGGEISLLPDLAPEPWPVRIDGAQFDSCILNLANNARDAMPQGGRLHVVTRNVRLDDAYAAANHGASAGDYVMIEVTDTGSGMPAEAAARAFEPFFTTKPIGHGTGLGLSMVYGFVKQSGGHISLYSEPGQGTTVRMYLPRDRHAGLAPTLDTLPAARPMPTGSEFVLVVEDNEQLRQTAVAQLTSLGYRVVEAENGPAALAILDHAGQPLDLLFTDVVMPGEPDGYGLARLARERRPGIRVLITSGFPGDALNRNGGDIDLPMLGKPYRKEELARTLRAVLDAPARGD